jgi:hypothetical protein
VRREPLGLLVEPGRQRPTVPPLDAQLQPLPLRAWSPGPDHLGLAQHRTRPSEDAPQVLAPHLVGHEQRAVTGLQPGVERVEQPHALSGWWVSEQRDVEGEHAAPLAVDHHLDGVVGPPSSDGAHRGVEVAGDLLRRRRPEAPQYRPDRVELGRWRLGGAVPAEDRAQDRRRGRGGELQAGEGRAEAERLLVGVDRVAGTAVAQVRGREPGREGAGHLPLHGGSDHELTQVSGDDPQRLEHGDARVPQGLGGVEDPLGRVRLVVGRDGCHHLGGLRPPVGVRSAAQRPQMDQRVVLDRTASERQRPPGRPRAAGVLHPEVQDRVVDRAGRRAEPLLRRPEPQHLRPRDLHGAVSYQHRGRRAPTGRSGALRAGTQDVGDVPGDEGVGPFEQEVYLARQRRDLRGRPLPPTRGQREHQPVGQRREVVARARVGHGLDHDDPRRRPAHPGGFRRSTQQRHRGRVFPVVQDVDEQVRVAARRHAGERVAGDRLHTRPRRHACRDLGQFQHHPLEVRVLREQDAEQRPVAASDVADAPARRPVERAGEQQTVHPPTSRHGGIEDRVALGVLGHPAEERRAVGCGERVPVGGQSGIQGGERAQHLGAGGELDPRPPSPWVVPAQEPRQPRRSEPSPPVQSEHPARRRVPGQAIEPLGVDPTGGREFGARDRPVQPLRDLEPAQSREHGEVERSERPFEHASRRGPERTVQPRQSGPHPSAEDRGPRGGQDRHAEHLCGADRSRPLEHLRDLARRGRGARARGGGGDLRAARGGIGHAALLARAGDRADATGTPPPCSPCPGQTRDYRWTIRRYRKPFVSIAVGLDERPVEDLTARARIRDAAIAQFAEHGFRAATIKGIAAAAGVSPGLVQHHYGTKERLREACDRAAVERVQQQLEVVANADQEVASPDFASALYASSPLLVHYLIRLLLEEGPAAATLFDALAAGTERFLSAAAPEVFPRGRNMPAWARRS